MLSTSELRDAIDATGRAVHERDGRLVVPTPRGAQQLWLDHHVADGEICVQFRSADRVARELWPATLAALDDWNRNDPFSKAFLTCNDWDHDLSAAVVVETTVVLPPDATGPEVVDLVDLTAAAGLRCWAAISKAANTSGVEATDEDVAR